MRAVIQRVKRASVVSDGILTGAINRGLIVFVGIESNDSTDDVTWLCRKIPHIRIFEDENNLMNRSVQNIGGEILVISQFTLYGNLRKGTRPSFNHAAPPDIAIPLYNEFLTTLTHCLGKPVASGKFAAHMEIEALNDGPVTLLIDTKNKKL